MARAQCYAGSVVLRRSRCGSMGSASCDALRRSCWLRRLRGRLQLHIDRRRFDFISRPIREIDSPWDNEN